MGSPACPDRETLAAFARGQLAGPTLEGIAHHVDGCPECLAIVQETPPATDPLLDALRRPGQDDPFLREPECRQAVARFQQVPPPAAPTDAPQEQHGGLEQAGPNPGPGRPAPPGGAPGDGVA